MKILLISLYGLVIGLAVTERIVAYKSLKAIKQAIENVGNR